MQEHRKNPHLGSQEENEGEGWLSKREKKKNALSETGFR